MASDDDEIRLAGGNITSVVKVGDTVRRNSGPWTPAVHSLLEHLDSVGFEAPRPLGIDEAGREVLTYVEGECGATQFEDADEFVTISDSAQAFGESATILDDAPTIFGDTALIEVGRLVRRFHDAVATFKPPEDARWRVLPGAEEFLASARQPVIIGHNDLAMSNTIYRNHRPVSFIDWDLAAPATRAWDLAYAAWRFVPLTNDADIAQLGWTAVKRAERLRLFCDAYGLEIKHGRNDFLTTVQARMRASYNAMRDWGAAGVAGFDRMWVDGHAEGVLRDLDFLNESAEAWQGALD